MAGSGNTSSDCKSPVSSILNKFSLGCLLLAFLGAVILKIHGKYSVPNQML